MGGLDRAGGTANNLDFNNNSRGALILIARH